MKIAFVYNRKDTDSVEEAEFDTQETIDAISASLRTRGDEIFPVPMTKDESWISHLRKTAPDLIFNTAEGYHGIGRESYGPIVFEQLGVPYVGPGPYVCFLTLDKFLTKQMVSYQKVPIVEGIFVTRVKEIESAARSVEYPVFVKPNYEGSSKGITSRSLCRSQADLLSYGKESLKQFPEGLIIERFIPGRDISIGYLAGVGKDGILDPVEYQVAGDVTENWIYDYDFKNNFDEKVTAVCPARLDEGQISRIKGYMRSCVSALGIVDLGRADFRVTPDGEIFFMEFNALPSLQPGAGMFEATKLYGLNYNETLRKILDSAIRRMKIKEKRPSHNTSTKSPKIALVYNLRRKKVGEEGFENEAEFDSQSTIDHIFNALKGLGHDVTPIEANRDLAQQLNQNNIDVVFNIAEGIASRARESQVPAICDLMGIHYTGSDATCLSVTLDKAVAKRIVAAEGIHTPKSKLFSHPVKKLPKDFDLEFPIIVKPNYEGTSKGISEKSVVHTHEDLVNTIESLWQNVPGPILVEEYIQGREFTIGLVGSTNLKVLGPLEIRFKKGDFPTYSLEAKMDSSPEDNEFLTLVCPVKDLSSSVHRSLVSSARKAFHVLNCRDVSRVDFRLDDKGRAFFLEVNPLPGLSPGFSDLAIMAERHGWEYKQLIKAIIDPAIHRWRMSKRRFPQVNL